MSFGRIAIGTRIGEGRCDPLFFRSWQRLILTGLRVGDTVIDPACEMPHHFSANWLVREFRKSGADTLCMVDSDMVFEPGVLALLRDAPGSAEYDVLSALCTTRRDPISPVLLRWDAETKAWRCHNDAAGEGIFDVSVVALPFCLIRRTVFERIEARINCNGWFFDWGPRGFGEDTTFSVRARECGCRLGVLLGAPILHRGAMAFGWDVAGRRPTFTAHDQINTFGQDDKEG
jgi:GT2 family glycosyltransferase